ncbi:MAG: pantetheine-phosphate adenylyltransferase [Bacteroidales bacterium]|nr:pantetheine-phosphate adenylyltransferase [Candidatus Egerieousia equi]MCQ2118203.1 pantetheine-phosphate adenylyltransferase [Bacteroidales bacterium]
MKTAIFPGSFDPFTIGHYDVLLSALQLFDKVIVAVGYNSTKKGQGYFSPETRVRIIKDAVAGLENVEVCSYTELTIDLCRRLGARYIVRGLRTTTDFELESVIAQANKKMDKEITTVFIPASQEYSFISSTVAKDVLIHNGDTSLFFPPNVDISKYPKDLQ